MLAVENNKSTHKLVRYHIKDIYVFKTCNNFLAHAMTNPIDSINWHGNAVLYALVMGVILFEPTCAHAWWARRCPFCPSVCPSVCPPVLNTRTKVTRKKFM